MAPAEGTGIAGRISLFRRNPTWTETPSTTAFNDNQLHVVTARFVSATLALLYVDGTEVASSTAAVTLPVFNRFDMGNNGRSNATTDPYEGQTAEVLVYNQDITSTSRTRTEDYLKQKWITGSTGISIGSRRLTPSSSAESWPFKSPHRLSGKRVLARKMASTSPSNWPWRTMRTGGICTASCQHSVAAGL